MLLLSDVSDHEALHSLMGLDHFRTNATLIKINLDSSKEIKKTDNGNCEFISGFIDNYATRNNLTIAPIKIKKSKPL